MLILVAVTVNVAVNSGLFGHAKNATSDWKAAEEQEGSIGNGPITINGKEYASIEEYIKETGGGTTPVEPDTPSEEPKVAIPGVRVTENTEYTSDGKTATIPAKFTVSGIVSEQSIDEGLVIYLIPEGTTVDWTNADAVKVAQETYDQFVWIPVANINDMYMCQSEDGTKSCRITVENGKAKCTTHNSENMAGRLYASKNGDNFNPNLTTQTYTADSGFREPDVSEHEDTDTNLAKINCILETSYTAENFKAELQREYNEIVKSVYENHGFYIGRYETSNITETNGTSIKSIAGVSPSSYISWYYMYAQQRDYATNNGLEVGSTMIQGAAYDQVMKFVNTASYDVKANTNVGHEKEDFTTRPYQTGGRDYSTNYKGTKVPTFNDISKNIFDLEGNLETWTTEASGNTVRVSRGSNFDCDHSASRRFDTYPTSHGKFDYIGSISQLYVK